MIHIKHHFLFFSKIIQYLGYGTCVINNPNLYLHYNLSLLNLSSGLNLAGCALNV